LVRSISFFRNGEPIVVLCYYATHPMSYYRTGQANPDFVGIARSMREKELGFPYIYFTGAGENVTAGKYNDGAKENRQIVPIDWRRECNARGRRPRPPRFFPATHLGETKWWRFP